MVGVPRFTEGQTGRALLCFTVEIEKIPHALTARTVEGGSTKVGGVVIIGIILLQIGHAGGVHLSSGDACIFPQNRIYKAGGIFVDGHGDGVQSVLLGERPALCALEEFKFLRACR